MISGTDFQIHGSELITKAAAWLPSSLATPSDLAEIRAECDANRALCLACDDGMVVITVRAIGEELEMFVWLAVAFRFGSFERQVPAMLAIARELGCSTIAFEARRRGWARRLGLEWLRRGTNEFVRDVPWVEAPEK